MKNKTTLVLSLFLGAICLSCSISSTCANKSKGRIIPQEDVVTFLSDSVCSLVFEASKVNLYKIEAKQDSIVYSPDSLLLDYSVIELFQNIDSDLVSALRFVLSDKKTYLMSDYYPSAPFLPGYVIEFETNEAKCRMLISISGGLCRLYWNNEILQEFKYTQERLLTYFLFLATRDESLQTLLESQ